MSKFSAYLAEHGFYFAAIRGPVIDIETDMGEEEKKSKKPKTKKEKEEKAESDAISGKKFARYLQMVDSIQ